MYDVLFSVGGGLSVEGVEVFLFWVLVRRVGWWYVVVVVVVGGTIGRGLVAVLVGLRGGRVLYGPLAKGNVGRDDDASTLGHGVEELDEVGYGVGREPCRDVWLFHDG